MSYERSNIQALHAYVPGEQPRTQRVIKLNTNENPYPPAPVVLEAIRAVTPESLRRYPSPRADSFRELAAEVHGVNADQVIATNGGDELLRLAITVFCEPRNHEAPPESLGGLGVAEPSYSLYPVLAAIHETPLTRIPLAEEFSLPDDFAEQLNAAGCRLAMVVNPHAPSGRREPVEKLERLARQFHGVLLIDEAYVDFAQGDALSLVRPGAGVDNVLLLRSLSKGYSLAGLRFGYGLGAPGLIAAMNKARDSYNTDVLAQAAAYAALAHRHEAAATWQKVIAERQRITQALRQSGWHVPDSETNFILATPGEVQSSRFKVQGSEAHPASQSPNPQDSRLSGGKTQDFPAARIYESLKARGIFVRYFDQERLRDKLRITIGTPEQNNALLQAVTSE